MLDYIRGEKGDGPDNYQEGAVAQKEYVATKEEPTETENGSSGYSSDVSFDDLGSEDKDS